MTTLATLQHLRSFNDGEHPVNLEPGQIAFNMASENFQGDKDDYNMYMYVGNASNQRIDEGGTVLVTGGLVDKGWVRYRLRNVSVLGDNVFGDFSVLGAKLKVESNGSALSELVIPKESSTPSSGTETGSVRWNSSLSILQAWNGAKWDSTSKVTIGETAPVNPSNGDLWLDPGSGTPTVLYVYVIPSTGPASWVAASSDAGETALQPGNGVTPNSLNQIETIDSDTF